MNRRWWIAFVAVVGLCVAVWGVDSYLRSRPVSVESLCRMPLTYYTDVALKELVRDTPGDSVVLPVTLPPFGASGHVAVSDLWEHFFNPGLASLLLNPGAYLRAKSEPAAGGYTLGVYQLARAGSYRLFLGWDASREHVAWGWHYPGESTRLPAHFVTRTEPASDGRAGMVFSRWGTEATPAYALWLRLPEGTASAGMTTPPPQLVEGVLLQMSFAEAAHLSAVQAALEDYKHLTQFPTFNGLALLSHPLAGHLLAEAQAGAIVTIHAPSDSGRGGETTMRTGRSWRPWRSRPAPAARALSAQSALGKPATV